MTGSGFGRLAALLAALAALFALPGAAQAASAPLSGHACIAYSSLATSPQRDAATMRKWACNASSFDVGPERAMLRFELPRGGTLPDRFTTRRGAFERLHLMVVDADGAVRTRSYGLSDMELGGIGAIIAAKLPPVTENSRAVIAAFDRPAHVLSLETGRIVTGDPRDTPRQRSMLLLMTLLCGMLLTPLAFNIAFYRVLRESFLLWHAAMALTLLGVIVFTSGLSGYLADLDMTTLNVLMTLIYGGTVSTGAMFACTFIEPGKLHPRLRRALPMVAVWATSVSIIHAFFPLLFRSVQSDLYSAAYIPVLIVLFWTIYDAFRRGSRSVRFQLAGWLPLLMVGTVRAGSELIPSIPGFDGMVFFYAGIVFESLATTVGVADRFLAIRRQRDTARTEADLLEHLSEHDPLTGLLNRRAIEPRFGGLRDTGFDTFALLDLDHFKQVNDEFGHGVGDKVLRAVSQALQGHPDTMAVRMGGEEFALLMCGDDTRERAERIRQSIPVRVAHAVPQLDRMVTASMGLLELPRSGLKGIGFKEFYAKADKLLYEAKSGGRNRLIAEKMRVFVPRRVDRRRAA
jgi:diguanylate cyclase (GGDEF)-like protein